MDEGEHKVRPYTRKEEVANKEKPRVSAGLRGFQW
jgi:hypothetical protein